CREPHALGHDTTLCRVVLQNPFGALWGSTKHGRIGPLQGYYPVFENVIQFKKNIPAFSKKSVHVNGGVSTDAAGSMPTVLARIRHSQSVNVNGGSKNGLPSKNASCPVARLLLDRATMHLGTAQARRGRRRGPEELVSGESGTRRGRRPAEL